MPPQQKTIGGGGATGVANDLYSWLSNGLNSGTFGTGGRGNPVGSTMGISGILNDILSQGGGKVGGSIQDMIARQTQGDVGDLRARYGAGGGLSYGTPAGMAEAGYRAQAAERAPMAIGQLQLSALQSLLPLYGQSMGLGTPQAQTIMQQNPWAAGLSQIGGLAATLASHGVLGGQPDPFSSQIKGAINK